jgi:hypothetical protein
MNPPNNELPPLKNIEKSGTFLLKLTKPKDDKMLERLKVNKKGYASCRLFFVDGDGNCMTKNYSVEFGKGLAMLVGKLTGSFCPEPPTNMTVENLIRFVSPAFGKKATIEIDVTPDKEWNGKMQFNYKLTKITPVEAVGYKGQGASDVPESFSSEAGESVPF